jgi:hypothetical protein
MKCPRCGAIMIFSDSKPDKTLWYYCDCWYCKLIHHPIRKLLQWIDNNWYEKHKKITERKSKKIEKFWKLFVKGGKLANKYFNLVKKRRLNG